MRRGLRVGRPAAHLLVVILAACLLRSETAADELSFLPAEQNRAEFEALCVRVTDSDNGYFGHRVFTDLERRIEATSDPLTRLLLDGQYAHQLMRVGDLEAAIDRLETSLELIRATPRLAGDLNLIQQYHRLLGQTHLQLAEDRNCIANHSATSCILPLKRGALHTVPDAARTAGDYFLRLLETDPADIQARWLLNLARALTGDYPERVPEQFRVPEGSIPLVAAASQGSESHRWPEIGWALGIAAVRDLSGGAVMDDFDGDGLLDLVSSSWDPCEPMKAFRNDGAGGFEDVSDAWGLSSQLGGLNIVQTDFDGDGRLDVQVLRGAWLGDQGTMRNSLLRNDLGRESGRFVDVTSAARMDYPAYPTQNAAWADYDLDGDLDVFIGNESTSSNTDPLLLYGAEGNPYPSQLFRNNGDGTFTDVARQAGVQNARFAKGSAWGDYDDDGDPDLYVSNIGPNRLYRNNGDGTFEDVATELDVVAPEDGSFPTWFFDFDNDGDLDLFVASYNTKVAEISATWFGAPNPGGNPVIYVNDAGRFTDASEALGLDQPLLVMGANYGDLDNDGWKDMYLGTGVPDFDALMPNVMYRNVDGNGFEDVTFSDGFGHLQKGHGVAFGDIDNDGQQEIFQQLGGAYPYDRYGNALYDNPGSDNRWLVLRLRGSGANRFGIGARVEVRVTEGGRTRSIHQLVGAGGSFGGSSLQQEIGLGLADRIDSIVVRWPGSEKPQVLHGAEPNAVYDVVQDAPDLVRVSLPPITFTDPAQAANHRHQQP